MAISKKKFKTLLTITTKENTVRAFNKHNYAYVYTENLRIAASLHDDTIH